MAIRCCALRGITTRKRSARSPSSTCTSAVSSSFGGVIGRLPVFQTGVTKEQAIAALRDSGQDSQADLLSGVDFVPGQGVDFGRLAQVCSEST